MSVTVGYMDRLNPMGLLKETVKCLISYAYGVFSAHSDCHRESVILDIMAVWS